MATTETTATPVVDDEGDQCVVLRGIDWKGYRTLLRLRGERAVPRMVYLDGDLWLMSPSYIHENLAKRLGWFVLEVAVGLQIPFTSARQTTLRRRKKDVGVEGDDSFYFAHVERLRGKTTIDLRVDPPPDLALEAVYSHGARAALEVYRRLGVPEVWVGAETRLRILVLQANGEYAESESSAAFPFLKTAEIADWIYRPQDGSETQWLKDVRRWVRATLIPRVRPPAPEA